MPLGDQETRRRIALDLVARGIEPTKKLVDELSKSVEKVSKSFTTANAASKVFYGSVSALGRMADSVSKSFLGFSLSIGGVISGVKTAMGVMKSYNDLLLTSAASAARYGQGITFVENRLNNLSKSIVLTRQETMKLFGQYQQSFTQVSFGGFGKLVEKISDIVGPSAENIASMMTNLSATLSKMPEFQKSMEQMTKEDIKRLTAASERVYMSGRMQIAEYKQFASYLSYSAQLTEADKKRIQDVKDQQKVFQEFHRWMETVALSLAKAAMPVIRALAAWLNDNESTVKNFFAVIGQGVKSVINWFSDIENKGKSLILVLQGLAAVWVATKLGGIATSLGGGGIGKGMGRAALGMGGVGVALAGDTAANAMGGKMGWAAGVGSAAIGGAMIGGMIGPWGAVAGGIIGAGVGVWRRLMSDEKKAVEDNEKLRHKIRMEGLAKEEQARLDSEKRSEEEKKKVLDEIEKYAEGLKDKPFDISEAIRIREEAKTGGPVAEGKHMAMKERFDVEERALNTFNELRDSGTKKYDSLIERAATLGDIESSQINASLKEALSYIDTSIELEKKMIVIRKQYLESTDDIVKTMAEEEYFNLTGLKLDTSEMGLKSRLLDSESKILQMVKQRPEYIAKITEQYAIHLKYASAQAQQFSLLNTLANNFAMGIRASATMLMKEAQAIGGEINVLVEQKQKLQSAMDNGIVTEKERVKVETDILDLNNKILDRQVAQAEKLKALRDGYVSAISAMNTGAGRFTKIIISQEQNIAASLAMGAAISSYTGATRGLAGGYGSRLGFLGSSKFASGGLGLSEQVTATGGFAGAGDLPYYTGRGNEDFARQLVNASRESSRRLIEQGGGFLAGRVAAQGAGGGAMLSVDAGAAGSGRAGITDVRGGVRSIGAGTMPTPGITRGMVTTPSRAPSPTNISAIIPSVNVTVHWDNIDKLPQMISDALLKGLGNYSQILNSQGNWVGLTSANRLVPAS